MHNVDAMRNLLKAIGLFLSRSNLSAKPAAEERYRAYTKRFDRVITAEALIQEHHPALVDGRPVGDVYKEFLQLTRSWRIQTDIAALEAGARVKARIGKDSLKDTVVSLLIDHSGSMRGQKTLLTMDAVAVATELLVNLGVKVEVLGFTTSSWQGGTSRWLWLNRGKPPRPGRLCDLLHIIYREADDTSPGSAQNLGAMLLPDILKENVDGEAIEWAVERLRMRPEGRKRLIVLSDGAPVDDSTLDANEDNYLMRHLVQVIAEVTAAADIAIAGLGICYTPKRLYQLSEEITTPDDLKGPLIDLLEKVLVDADTGRAQGTYH